MLFIDSRTKLTGIATRLSAFRVKIKRRPQDKLYGTWFFGFKEPAINQKGIKLVLKNEDIFVCFDGLFNELIGRKKSPLTNINKA
jgi:hypothetical protein